MNEASLEQIAANLRIEAALLGLLELLDDLPVVVFKGPLLTKQIYADLRSRDSCDNDLWVTPEYCLLALDRLLEAGYQPLLHLDAHAAIDRAGQVALWPNGDFGRPSADLHCHPFSKKLFRVDAGFIEGYVQVTELHGVQVRHFAPVLALAHICAHAAQHFFPFNYRKEVREAFLSFAKSGHLGDFQAVAQKTCGLRLAQTALLWSGVSQVQLSSYCGSSSKIASLTSSFLVKKGQRSYLSRQAIVFFLTFGVHSLQSLYRAVFPTVDELKSRYQSGNWCQLQWSHLKNMLGGGGLA